jgi:hypothetical protein
MGKAIRIEGGVAYVPLSQGYEAIIDTADVPLVDKWAWCARVKRKKTGEIYAVYALRTCGVNDRKRGTLFLHRVIAGAPEGLYVDHIDGDGLNNRRANLRLATASQNQHNQRKSVSNKSGIKGVSWDSVREKWEARLNVNRRVVFLGRYSEKKEAEARIVFERERRHGEFARHL